jgi:hypothetical protein
MERCSCRCHSDAAGDVREARHHGRMFESLLAQNREDNLAARHPDGPLMIDEIAAFFACSACQPRHSVALRTQPSAELRGKAEWPREWGAKPFDYGVKGEES